MQRKAIVIGATGLVGQHLIKQLSEIYDTLIVIAAHRAISTPVCVFIKSTILIT